MTELYPMFFKPVFKDYVWGGRNLEKLGRNLPETGVIAESWEISSHDDGMTVVENGVYAGKTLKMVFDLLGEDLVGTKNKWALSSDKFPLLIKLLDANQRLSVQVHPNDGYALENEGNELGKTEMWVILDAKPGAAIIYGLNQQTTADDLNQAISDGMLEQYLNVVPIKTNDHICVPSGTLHAILEGAILAEIQQNSNTTYRVYDWNRLGDDGQLRPLHVEKALDVINYDQIDLKLQQAMTIDKQEFWVCERLCKNQYFTTDRYHMSAGARYSGDCDGTTLEIWGVLSGKVTLAGYDMTGVRFILLPAAMGKFNIIVSEEAVLLRIFVE